MFWRKKVDTPVNWWEKYFSHKHMSEEEVEFCSFFTEDGFNTIFSGFFFEEWMDETSLITLKDAVSKVMDKFKTSGFRSYGFIPFIKKEGQDVYF